VLDKPENIKLVKCAPKFCPQTMFDSAYKSEWSFYQFQRAQEIFFATKAMDSLPS